jgi:phosphatidylcholine synthase
MASDIPPSEPSRHGPAPRAQRAKAFSVHILTASGAAIALLALMAAVRGEWTWMFGLLGLALIVDGVDGTFARRFKVAETLPNWSGDALDLVVDFGTYVFVPAFAIVAGGLMPLWLAVPLAVIIVITGAIYFADRRMKTSDNFFRGFPTLWNAVAFYLFILQPPAWVTALVILALAALTFAPIRFVHPVRVERWRTVTLVALVLWAVLALAALYYDLNPGPWVVWPLVVLGFYFFAIGFSRADPAERKPP